MKLKNKKQQKILEECLNFFWKRVANSFPEIKTRDLDLDLATSSKLEEAMGFAILHFEEDNQNQTPTQKKLINITRRYKKITGKNL